MQLDGLAGPVPAELLSVCVKTSQPVGLKIAQASVGRGNQESAAFVLTKEHADVSGSCVHISAFIEAATNATNLMPRRVLVHPLSQSL
jgi:hypothetical protein